MMGKIAEKYGKYTDYKNYTMLSANELAALKLKNSGMPNAKIADKLGLTVGTVGVYLRRSLKKIDGVWSFEKERENQRNYWNSHYKGKKRPTKRCNYKQVAKTAQTQKADQRAEKIITEIANGKSVYEVAGELGCSKQNIYSIIDRYQKRATGATKGNRKIEILKTYGKITVLCASVDSGKTYKIYNCRCEICGHIFSQRGQDILKYQDMGCPECRKKQRKKRREEEAKSYIGEIYGQLEAIGFVGLREMGNKMTPIMKCLCHNCMKKTEIPLVRLRAGQAKECAQCARKNLRLGHGDIRGDIIEGTMVAAIDGRRAVNKNNTSGHNGVSHTKTGKWRAYIFFKGKQYHLGTYESINDAIAAREAAEKELYGDFLEWYAENYPEKWEKLQSRKT